MIIIASNGRSLIRDNYPRDVVRIDTEAEERASLDDTKVKPLEFERLFEWAMVTSAIPSADRSRTMQCVLKPSPQSLASTNSLQRVAIRVYGFLGKHNFTPTGNWNRCVCIDSFSPLLPFDLNRLHQCLPPKPTFPCLKSRFSSI